jgi:hypothetical protein
VTLDGGPAAARQEPKALIQVGGDLQRRHRGDPRRRQFDGEGNPIQAATNLRDRLGVPCAEGEVGTGRAGPLHEKQHSVTSNLFLLDAPVGRKRQRTQRNDPLALQG